MELCFYKTKILLGFAIFLGIGSSSSVSSSSSLKAPQNHIFRQYEEVADGKYKIRWDVDFDINIITFEIEAETTGYIGFGISPTGGMAGADIVIGGVKDSEPYFQDRHGIGRDEPPIDASQDYELITASENGTHTYLKFSRLLNTCDEVQDVAITADTQKFIWSMGATDDIAHHGTANRGTGSAIFLDPPMPPVDTSKLDKWSLERDMVMPSAYTSYWCTVHKSPDSYKKERHVVGFNTRLDGSNSLAHTHHLNVFKCTAPTGVDPDVFFGQFIGHPGGECYASAPVIPTDYCRTLLYGWAVGGKSMFFPDHVGYPINEGGAGEYVMLEIHYNNPDQKENVKFTSAVEIFSTPLLRQESAALLVAAHSVSFSHLIPPGASEFLTVSHCGPACTGRTIDKDGIKLINVLLHGHLLGRKMRLRHFRGNVELPWIAVDDQYDFDYQQNRPLREEILVLPGDQLTMECTTDSSARNGITIGGLSTTAEMCQGIIWYYPRGELMFCESAYDELDIMQRFGVEGIDWTNILEPPIVTAPEPLAGKSFIDVVNNSTTWTPKMIAELQQELSFTHHYESSCGTTPIPEDPRIYSHTKKSRRVSRVGYPEVDKEYAPADQCKPPSNIGDPCSSDEDCDGFGQDCGDATPKLCRCSQYYKEVGKDCKPKSGAPCRENSDCQNEELHCAEGKCNCKGEGLTESEDGICKAGNQNILASTITIVVAFIAVQLRNR